MNYAVMPLADYDAVCNKIREKAEIIDVKFKPTDFGYLASAPFAVESGKAYTFDMELTDSNLFSDFVIENEGWANNFSPWFAESEYPFTFEAKSTRQAVCIYLHNNKGLTPNDIVSATVECNGEIVANFVEPKKIKSGEMADKVEDVYRAGQFDIMDSFEAFKGNAVGQVVSINDVSPIEHNVGVELSSDPIADFSGVKVSVGGKNLLNLDRERGTLTSGQAATSVRSDFEFDKFYEGYIRTNAYYGNGYSTTTIVNGVVSVTANNAYMGCGMPFRVKPNTTYTFNGELSGDNPYVTVSYYDCEGNFLSQAGICSGSTPPPRSFTTPSNCTTVVLGICPQIAQGTAVVKDVQIEQGTTATEYEPYIEPTVYTANADGVVAGVKSRYPSMSFSTDAEGVIINVNYYRDVDKVLNNLTTSIALSGGN